MFRRIGKERILIGVTIAVFLLFSLFETVYGFVQAGVGERYTFLHNFPEDYFYYLHIMRQGFEGNVFITSRMTPEAYPSQFAVPFFVVLGFLARLIPIGLDMWYLVARIVGAILLMGGVYVLIGEFFHDRVRRFWALVLTLSGSFLPIIQDGKLVAPAHVLSWSELDPLIRLTYIPHHLWSKVLFVFLIIVFVRWVGRPTGKPSRLVGIGVLSLAMGFTSPVIQVTFAVTVGLWLGVEIMLARRLKQPMPLDSVIPGSTALLGAGAVMAYHWGLAHSVFPWTTYGPPWENNWLMLFSPWEYLTMLGGLLAVSIVGIASGFRTDRKVRLLTCWIASGWILSFVLRKLLPFSGSRYLSGYQWIPIGILSAYGMHTLTTRFPIHNRRILFEVSIGILILLQIPSLGISVTNAIRRVDRNRTNPQYYMNTQIEGALQYLSSLKPPCTVAAPDWFSPMIAANSPCRSVSGHRLMTYANDAKVYEMNEFFYSSIPLEIKKKRITEYRITHVITMDGITGSDILSLLQQHPEYVSGGTRVYRVLPSSDTY